MKTGPTAKAGYIGGLSGFCERPPAPGESRRFQSVHGASRGGTARRHLFSPHSQVDPAEAVALQAEGSHVRNPDSGTRSFGRLSEINAGYRKPVVLRSTRT